MKHKAVRIFLVLMLLLGVAGCGGGTDADDTASADASEASADASGDYDTDENGMQLAEQVEVGYDGMQAVYASSLNPGTYEITVESTSSMFVITSCELTVSEDGTMTAHMVLSGTAYGYLYLGTAEEAEAASEADWIADEAGEEEKNTFTMSVEALNSGISCAAYSKKNDYWYDRTLVFRADSLPDEALAESLYTTAEDLGLSDGSYTAEVTLSGGSGKAGISSPASLTISGGQITATIIWSSSNYDYMIVDDETYLPVSIEEYSVFEIPVEGFDFPMTVIADTTAMSKPYEIEYTLLFDSASISEAE